MDTEDMVNVMEGHISGYDIEARRKTENAWIVVDNPTWDWEHNEYRVKE